MRELTEAEVRYRIDRTRVQTRALFFGCLFTLVLVLLAFFGVIAAGVLIVLIVGIASVVGALIGGGLVFTFEEHARRAIAELPNLVSDPQGYEQRHSRVLRIRWTLNWEQPEDRAGVIE